MKKIIKYINLKEKKIFLFENDHIINVSIQELFDLIDNGQIEFNITDKDVENILDEEQLSSKYIYSSNNFNRKNKEEVKKNVKYAIDFYSQLFLKKENYNNLKNVFNQKKEKYNLLLPHIDYYNNVQLSLFKLENLNKNLKINELLLTYNGFNYYYELYKFLKNSYNNPDISNHDKDLLQTFKTVKVIKDTNGKYHLKSKDRTTSIYLIRLYKDILNIDKSKDINLNKNNVIVLDSKLEIVFLKYVLENNHMLDIDISELNELDQDFINSQINNFKSTINTDISYNEDVSNFIKKNKGFAVIADSGEEKNKAVIEYIKNEKDKTLLISNNEGLEKYKDLGLKNFKYIDISNFSKKDNVNYAKGIFEYKIDNNELFIDNNKIDMELQGNIVIDITRKKIKFFDETNIDIEKEYLQKFIVSLELYKLISPLIHKNLVNINSFVNLINKNDSSYLFSLLTNYKKLLKEFNLTFTNIKLDLKSIVKSKNKNFEFSDYQNKMSKLKIKNLKEENLYKNYQIKIDVNSKNKSDLIVNEFINMTHYIKDFSILSNKKIIEIKNFSLFEYKELELDNKYNQDYIYYYDSPNSNELIKLYKNSEYKNIIFLNAEKLKDTNSTIANTSLHFIKAIEPKNLLFVSSTPIYNKISEIETLLTAVDDEILNNINSVFSNYNTRQAADFRNNFLQIISKTYILKRSAEELNSILGEENIQKVSYLNPNKFINLNYQKEKEYFKSIDKKLEKIILNIVKNSLEKVERFGNTKLASYRQNNTNNYFADYEQFKILKGENISENEFINTNNLLKKYNLKELYTRDISIDNLKKQIYKTKNKDLISEFKDIVLKEREILNQDLYNKIMETKYRKAKVFDIEENRILDQNEIAQVHINEIDKIKNSVKYELTEKEFHYIFDDFVISPNKNAIWENFLDKYKDLEKRLKISDYYSRERDHYNLTFEANLKYRGDAKEKLKIIKSIFNKLEKIILGEEKTFEDILINKFNLKEIHKEISSLKMENTKSQLEYNIENNRNSFVFTIHNDVIKNLEKYCKSNNINYLKVTSTNKNTILKDLSHIEKPFIVLSNYKMLNENVVNNFDTNEGSIILNDLPWNDATIEQSVSSFKSKDINLNYSHIENNLMEKLFKNRIISKKEELEKIINNTESSSETFKIKDNKKSITDDKFYKKRYIQNIFKKVISSIDERKFLKLEENVKNKFEISKQIELDNIANNQMLF